MMKTGGERHTPPPAKVRLPTTKLVKGQGMSPPKMRHSLRCGSRLCENPYQINYDAIAPHYLCLGIQLLD